MKPQTTKAVLGLSLVILLLGLLSFSVKKVPHVEAIDTPNPLHPRQEFRADSNARTLSAAFTQAGVAYYPEDKVSAFPEPNLGIGTVVSIERALPVTIKDGKRTVSARTWETTVGGLLQEKHIELGDEDRVAPVLSTPLQANTVITITRVARTTVSEFESIPFETVQQDDPSSYRGTNTVTQEGKNGKREKKYLLIREDGELKSKTLTSNSIIEAVKNKIVKVGTKLKIGKTFSGKATYYENNLGTKVATDKFKRGTELRVTNLKNGKSIIVRNDGCICANDAVLIDLNPSYFQQLGGTLSQGVLPTVLVEEILP